MSEREPEPDTVWGITEIDFNRWKHHPVTRAVMKYLIDYESQLAEKSVVSLRNAQSTPDAFKLGEFKGILNAVSELRTLEFGHLLEFYPPKEEENDAA